MLYVAVTNDRRGAAQQMVEAWDEAGLSIDQVLQSPHALIGSVDDIVADLQQRKEQYGFSHIVISDDKIDEFAPIVEQLRGK